MRIAVVHNQPSGGARRSLYQLSKQLAKRHELDVYTLSTADEDFLSSRDSARRVHVTPFEPAPQRRFGALLNDWRALRDLAQLDRCYREIAARINGGSYDVAYIDACRVMQSPSVLRYLTVPSAYYCHEPPRRFTEPWCRPWAQPLNTYERARLVWRWPGRALYDRAVRALDVAHVEAAGVVMTNSAYTEGRIRDTYGREATICRWGVDGARFRPAAAEPAHAVISVGALEPHKGFDFAIQSLGLVPAWLRPELLIVANSDSAAMRRRLQREAVRAGVSIRIRARVSDDELAELYRAAKLMVYTPHREPFGLAPLEAMASGLPVVATNEGGVPESVVPGVNGLLTLRQERLFAAAVTELLERPQRRRELGANARAIVERDWTWEAAAARVESVLAGVAERTLVAVDAAG